MIDIEFVRISLFIITFVLGCLGINFLTQKKFDAFLMGLIILIISGAGIYISFQDNQPNQNATVLVKTTTDYQQVNETFIVNDERFKVNYITYPDQDNLRDKDVLQVKIVKGKSTQMGPFVEKITTEKTFAIISVKGK